MSNALNSLTKNEVTILYWKCKGLKYNQIALKLGYSMDWVQLHMSNVYKKLGFQKEMHWTKRAEILEKEICPKLPKDLKDLDIKEEIEASVEPKTQPKPDPEMLALVLYDEKQIEAIPNASLTPPVRETIVIQEPSKGVRTFRRFIFALIAAVILSLLGIFIYNLGLSAIPKQQVQTIIITATFPPTQAVANAPLSTNTPVPAIINTPVPTIAPPPTAAPKGYLDEGEVVFLKDGIYMYLSDRFTTVGGPCGKPDPGFGVIIVFENEISEQYLIRFNSGDFQAIDDLGNEYELEEVGISGAGFCSDRPGIPLEYTMDYGYFKVYLAMRFKGQVPLEAKYIFITAKWINGIGPTTFRKSIY